MTPEIFHDIIMRDKLAVDLSRAELDRRTLLDYIDLLRLELNMHKTQMREARAVAWDAGAQAGLDWDKNYPEDIRDLNPFKNPSGA